MRIFACSAAVMAVAVAWPLHAATFVVTSATIVSAFAAASAGDTLRLVGTFNAIRLQDRAFTTVVTLDASRALFRDTLTLRRVANVTVKGGRFDVTAGSAYNRAAGVYDSSHVAFIKPSVIGVGSQMGIGFQDTTAASVVNGRFDGLRAGIGFDRITGGLVTGNRITHAVADGIDIGSSHNVTASYNSCALGTPGPGVHPDCIQLWSTAGHPIQSDITVTHNTAVGPTQGFTSFASGGGGLRLTITNNTVTSSFPQGVACYDCIDSNISYNRLATLAGAAHVTNLNVIGGSGNTVVGNLIHARPPAGTAAAARFVAVADSGLAFGATAAGDTGAVPEPSTWAMLIAGFAAVGVARRRRQVRGVATGRAVSHLA